MQGTLTRASCLAVRSPLRCPPTACRRLPPSATAPRGADGCPLLWLPPAGLLRPAAGGSRGAPVGLCAGGPVPHVLAADGFRGAARRARCALSCMLCLMAALPPWSGRSARARPQSQQPLAHPSACPHTAPTWAARCTAVRCAGLDCSPGTPSSVGPSQLPPAQDEVRVLVRGNSLFFTSGYLGHLAVWILDTIHRCARGRTCAGRLGVGCLAAPGAPSCACSCAWPWAQAARQGARGLPQGRPRGQCPVWGVLVAHAPNTLPPLRRPHPAASCPLRRAWSAPAACFAWHFSLSRRTSAWGAACTW